MTGRPPAARPARARASAAVHAALAVLGFDVMRWLLRVVLPISLAFTGVLVALFLAHGRPATTPSAASSTRRISS